MQRVVDADVNDHIADAVPAQAGDLGAGLYEDVVDFTHHPSPLRLCVFTQPPSHGRGG
jgi:hypothetical protein